MLILVGCNCDTKYCHQEGDKRLHVTVGDNTSDGRHHNNPLEEDAAYWTLVVTEKKSGESVLREPRDPRRGHSGGLHTAAPESLI